MKSKRVIKILSLALVVSTFMVSCGHKTDNNQANNDINVLINKYLKSTTLPSLHKLPTISDEDGNTSDNKSTYTLKATTNVDVTIETPEGNWITPMWRYNNNPLPVIIRANRGELMTLTLDNNLTSDSTIHWHGFKISADMDGGPDYPVAPNTSKVYTFTMDQAAAPLWFHPHPDMQTGKQVYMGLAGVYLLEDNITKELQNNKQLPSGDKDTVLLVQDRKFTNLSNGIKYLDYSLDTMSLEGIIGDTILVNGSVVPKNEVTNTLHRYRLYNVSNARTYDFALSDGSNFTVVGTDGGLLKNPVILNHIKLGPAERVEIVIDFSKYSVDEKVMLISNAFNSSTMGSAGMGGSGMGGNGMMSSSMMNGNGSRNGEAVVIMRFDITSSEVEDIALYTTLPSSADISNRIDASTANNLSNEREFVMSLGMNSNMNFLINGKSFDPNRIDEYIPAGATEIWKITNTSPIAHPFHAHAIQYQILTRNGQIATGTDLGYKDTFLVEPGDSVRIIGDFSSAIGDYMYHCHILEHEDAGMMGYFRVGSTGNIGN